MSTKAAGTQEKKKRSTKRTFAKNIRDLQKAIVGDNEVVTGLNTGAGHNLNMLAETFIDKVADAAAILLRVARKEIVKEKVMRAAVMLVLAKQTQDGGLAQTLDSAGADAVESFKQWVAAHPVGTGKKAILSEKTGLTINPVRVDKRFRHQIDHKDVKKVAKKGSRSGHVSVSPAAYVYLAGAVQELLADILASSNTYVAESTHKRKRLTPWHLVQVVRADMALNGLFGDVLLSGGSIKNYKTKAQLAKENEEKKKEQSA